jgi:hypothetical protein
MIAEEYLHAEDVRGMMLDVMERHLSLKTEGYRSTTHETLNLLLKAVAEGSYTCKGRAQDGTTHFFRIASAYVIWREVRLTLALTYVLPEDDLADVVARLLQRLRQLGLHATVLYLDKGFCCGSIIRYLQRS